MAVNQDLKCSAACGAPMTEARVEKRDGVLLKVPFGENPVRAICENCGADLQIALTRFAIGGLARAASRTDHDFHPLAHAHAVYRNDDTGESTDLGRVAVGTDSRGGLAVAAGPEVESALKRFADEAVDRSKLN